MSIERIVRERTGSCGQHSPNCWPNCWPSCRPFRQALPARACVQSMWMLDAGIAMEVIVLQPRP